MINNFDKKSTPEPNIFNFNDIENLVSVLEKEAFLGRDQYNRNAVFDLDNTLLIGDIGDALFSMLKKMKVPLSLSWKSYLDILKNEGKESAYSKVVSTMAGLSVELIEKATEEVLRSKEKLIEVEGITVPIPRPHPLMLEFIELLKEKQFNIYIISATNIFTVRLASAYLFNIPKENSFGIEPETVMIKNEKSQDKAILTEKINEPLTISTGKETLYWDKVGKKRPLITAGDSETDIYLLNLVDPHGFSIWLGEDHDRYIKIRNKSTIPKQFFYLKR